MAQRQVFLTARGALWPQLAPITSFDPAPAGISHAFQVEFDPEQAFAGKNYRVIDRVGQMVLLAATATLEDAGLDAAWCAAHEVGMVLGTTFGSVRTIAAFDRRGMEAGPKYVKPLDFANTVINAAAGQAAIWLDLRGPNATVSMGPASGLLALAQGCDAIRSGRAEQLLVGGADELCFESTLACARAGLLAPGPAAEGLPFGAGRQGFVPSEGAAFLLAESEELVAQRPSRQKLARLLGHANRFDISRGRDLETAATSLAATLHAALAEASLEPADVDLVAVGASGLPGLDQIEAEGLARVFGAALARMPLLAVKATVGEPLGAGGIFQVIAAIEALRRGELPAHPGANTFAPELPRLSLAATPQPCAGRNVLVVSLAFDGSSTAVVLEVLHE